MHTRRAFTLPWILAALATLIAMIIAVVVVASRPAQADPEPAAQTTRDRLASVRIDASSAALGLLLLPQQEEIAVETGNVVRSRVAKPLALASAADDLPLSCQAALRPELPEGSAWSTRIVSPASDERVEVAITSGVWILADPDAAAAQLDLVSGLADACAEQADVKVESVDDPDEPPTLWVSYADESVYARIGYTRLGNAVFVTAANRVGDSIAMDEVVAAARNRAEARLDALTNILLGEAP